jgi:DNA-binding CsgD family transcriptional regulator
MFTHDARAYLVLQPNQGAPLSTRDIDLLTRALSGTAQKVIALDSGLAYATVATILKRSLKRLGVSAVPSRAPLLVSLLAQSVSNPAVTRELKCFSVSVSDQTYQVVSRELGASRWESLLSPAEFEVVLLRAEGRSHAEIAALRNTSLRTIANQVGNAFRRLGLSGRSTLLAGFAQAALH